MNGVHRKPRRLGAVLWLVGGGLAGLVALGAVGAAIDNGGGPARPSPSVAPSVQSTIPRPNSAQAAQLLAQLGRIHPGLAHERSVGRARNVCLDLLRGNPREEIVERARLRFDGGTAAVSRSDARRIVRLVARAPWCRATG